MARSGNARKWAEWQQRIKRSEKTQRSVKAFCREEGVSEASFYQWRRRLAEAAGPEEGEGVEAQGGFTPVRLVAATSIRVHLPGGMRLDIPTSDPQALRLVISTLARIDARQAGGGRC